MIARSILSLFAGVSALVLPATSHQDARVNSVHFTPPAEVGPRPWTRAVGAVAPADGDELARLLADADGPSELWLPARVYRGDFTIARNGVHLAGEQGAVLEGTGRGTVLEIHGEDVTVENLIVRGSGRRNTTEDAGVKASGARVRLSHLQLEDDLFGASLLSCRACAIERTIVRGAGGALRGDGIKLWEADDGAVTDSVVEDARDVVVWYSKRARLERVVVRGNRYGAHFMYAHDAVVRDCRFVDNVVGIFVMYSARLTAERNVLAGAHGAAGMGIGFKDSDRVTLRGNWIVANTTGAYLDRTPRSPSEPVEIAGNVIALNDTALRFHSSLRGATFAGNDFRDNVQAAAVEGGGDALGMDFHGNHWSDYAGYDLDHDGRGDVPFEVKQLTSAITDAHPDIRFFEGTAAVGMVDAVAQAVPVFSLRKMLVDAAPSVRPLDLVLP